ncbi:pyrroline-5-carboxylate reductase [Cognatishimia sp. WU-CL00825]|uniref:pyrroline-5-carboxylate reductase n=1 Tax=Cognatishimia sp. WU-CL00825 TaxID=3127658 RepID=UPI003101B62B
MNTILLVGAGNMGFSMLQGWLRMLDDSDRFVVVDPAAGPRLETLQPAQRARILALSDLAELPDDTQLSAAIFATKPNNVCDAVGQIRDRLSPETVLISVAAGLGIKDICQSAAPGQAVVRVMPNIGALIGRSASAGFASATTDKAQSDLVKLLFDALGHFTWLQSEEDMHLVTAVSGSGPAYFFAMCEAMIDVAMDSGLERDVAETLVHATCAAAGGLIDRTPDATTLRKQVTSPGGTTAAGTEALAKNDSLRTVMAKAIHAARQRSIEMS